ncbi:MAG: SgcJ/EcaC family oxidoreductase [Alphaproteobacteria bacterium]|nr:SgcJ/EcaC family oxidoreductase [Alphaproteobacteria bacterium]MBM3624553.1 SgcJ/EcaC family oxidoreductase [Alphaproteobacteria bacterium]
MTEDERAIRALVDAWMESSKAGDLPAVLDLTTDDAIFMAPGGKPFGEEAFAAASENMKNISIDGRSEIQELKVFGDWAYLRNYIEMTATPLDGGAPVRRTGHTLTILRKEADGRWRLARDANLLATEKS